MKHYEKDSDRPFGLSHEDKLVPYEYSSAYLVGMDAEDFVNTKMKTTIAPVLIKMADPESEIVMSLGVQERTTEEEYLQDISEYYRWLLKGLRLS